MPKPAPTRPTTTVPLHQRWGGAAFAALLRWGRHLLDFRVAYYDPSIDPRQPSHFETCIVVFWHEYLALPVAQWSQTPMAMLVSQHRDAEWLNQSAERLGFRIVRGSSTRGGTRAIRELRQLCETHGLGITPDGPRGPRRQMALGPIFLAAHFGMPIVPVGVGYHRPWRASTWDRFAVAKPFSRARVITGPKIHVPQRLSRAELEDYRRHVQSRIEQLTEMAEAWAVGRFEYRSGPPTGPADRAALAGSNRLATTTRAA